MAIARRLFAAALKFARDLFRELGDQNAYDRHLAAGNLKHSPKEWRRFADERFRAKYQRPKCC
jgi:hypothetical protein